MGQLQTNDTSDRRIDRAWFAFTQVNEWLRFADTKATALLATSGALGTVLLSIGPWSPERAPADLQHWGLLLSVILLAGSVAAALEALLPRLGTDNTPSSLVYFDHIARRYRADPDHYTAAFMAALEPGSGFAEDVIAQVWANSILARRKFRLVRMATWLLGLAMFAAAAATVADRL